ncbi:unnamed protein product [Sphenostylis stenocarpa]|uniref:Uncharacterized protein n=1 Tax=Sphenostylis stenocarpa TaxID=92480 RepID=A0AA86W047_9FABA|nr:unnamed protein product [Sphenostylis stenocarpa]
MDVGVQEHHNWSGNLNKVGIPRPIMDQIHIASNLMIKRELQNAIRDGKDGNE